MRTACASAAAGTQLTPALRFVVAGVAWSLGLLVVVRLSWVEATVIESLVEIQTVLARWYGAPAVPGIVVDSRCSGADVMAVCLAVALAFPAPGPRRLIGAIVGVALVGVLNTLRIATLLTVAASSPERLTLLHVYVWPALLMAGASMYVFCWTRWAGRASDPGQVWRRLGVLGPAFLLGHAVIAPWTFTSGAMIDAGASVARAAVAFLGLFGTMAVASDAVLVTSRGAFRVTPECLLTPVLPLYLAAVASAPIRPLRQLLAAAAAVPLFFALAVARVMVLALPASFAESPLVIVHGFYMLAVGVALIVAAGWRCSPAGGSRFVRPLFAVGSAAVAWGVAGSAWSEIVTTGALASTELAPHASTTLRHTGDTQGALSLLPAYQLALLTGLWSAQASRPRVRALAFALAGLAASQVALLVALGEMMAHTGVTAHPILVRAWSVIVPVAFVWLWSSRQPAARRTQTDHEYRGFWEEVGEEFPSLAEAASTRLYRDNEIRLLSQQVPNLPCARLLKTDLWDEAKNTRILQWAAGQGARVYGIDISEPIVEQARRAFAGQPLGASVADVRHLPFAAGTFDAVYSMGTIEHFAESESAVAEMSRVLKPGGRLVLGVPNRHDPFLRPLLVACLRLAGAYAYGREDSYSRSELRRMLHRAGLTVVAETGILFIPGWLRMLDLLGHTRAPWLERVTTPLVALFVRIDRVMPRVRRHGYLLASVGVRPLPAAGALRPAAAAVPAPGQTSRLTGSAEEM